MQFSIFNHICKLDGTNDYLLYNFLTGALLKIDEESCRKLESIELLSKEEKKLLLDNGFIIDNFDEIQYLKFGNKLACTDNELLSILIAPTMECNFRCPYCFEHHGTGMMSRDVQDEIISFIEASIINNKHKQLFVYWFGGEPLLGLSIIESMSQRILEMVRKYDISYSSAMSTNGYFLTQDVINTLEKCHLNRLQITLDGMKNANDKTRVLANGEGTFDVIVKNLKSIKTSIKIHIRSNLTRENANETSELAQLVSEIQKINQLDILLYGAHMSVYDFNNENVDALELSIKEYSDVLKKNNMIGTNKKTNCRFAFCDAAKVYSFCFDEKGNMYKCWNDIGTLEFAYDTVFDANRRGVNLISSNALSFLAESFPDECMKCKVLPICMGGCIKKRVIEHRKSCSPVKYNLDDYINKKYLSMNGGEINDTGN